MNRGVRQGDSLRPVLFNSVIDLALGHIDQGIGVRIGTEQLSCLAFGDDLDQLATQSIPYSSTGLLAQEVVEVSRSNYLSHCTILAPFT